MGPNEPCTTMRYPMSLGVSYIVRRFTQNTLPASRGTFFYRDIER